MRFSEEECEKKKIVGGGLAMMIWRVPLLIFFSIVPELRCEVGRSVAKGR